MSRLTEQSKGQTVELKAQQKANEQLKLECSRLTQQVEDLKKNINVKTNVS